MAHILPVIPLSYDKTSAKSYERIITWATIMTAFRVLCIPIIIVCITKEMYLIAAIITVAACISDFFDGFLANVLDCETAFGSWFDPVADKLLNIIVIYFDPPIGWAIMITEITGRQLSGPVRKVEKEKGTGHYIAPWSKLITFLQMLALISFCAFPLYRDQAGLCILFLSVIRLLIYRKEYNQKVKGIDEKKYFDTLANYITLIGLFLIPVLLYLNATQFSLETKWFIVILYGIAWLTDLLDGYFARKLDQRSEIGETLDTVRDFGLAIYGAWLIEPAIIPYFLAFQSLALFFFYKLKKSLGRHTIPEWSRKITFVLGIITFCLLLDTYVNISFLSPAIKQVIIVALAGLPLCRALVYFLKWYFERPIGAPYENEAYYNDKIAI